MTLKRVGFACKLVYQDDANEITNVPDCNVSTTTVAWLNRQTRDVAVERLWFLLKNNISSTFNLVKFVSNLDQPLRMVRLGSDILPVFTHPNWKWFWKQPDVIDYCEKNFLNIGELARKTNTRLSMHPGQFVVLGSDNPDIVDRSIEEFEYHANMARWMGYGASFQDFKINVHISGKAGPEGVRRAYQRLSPEARNTITIENEEISWGLDDCLQLSDLIPIVLDLHHHNINCGEYIEVNDDRIKKIINSWRGIRPVIHYSTSREDVLIDHPQDQRPDLKLLLESGHKKSKLRAHSDFMWNDALNEWAYTHWQWADVMVECKSKNLGAHKLYKFWEQL